MSSRPPHDPLSHSQLYGRSGAAQNRALRKQLLLLRSDVERTECVEAGLELYDAAASFKWLKLLLPGVGKHGLLHSAQHFNTKLSGLIGQYPMLSSLASLALAKPMRSILLKSAKPIVKWGGLGLLAWQAYRFWKEATVDEADAQPH